MREEIMSIMKKVNKTGTYSQYKTQRSTNQFIDRDSSIVHMDSEANGPTPEMNINNNYMPMIVGGDYEIDRMSVPIKNKIDIQRYSVNSNLTTNVNSGVQDTTHEQNSVDSIRMGTFDERKQKNLLNSMSLAEKKFSTP